MPFGNQDPQDLVLARKWQRHTPEDDKVLMERIVLGPHRRHPRSWRVLEHPNKGHPFV